MKNMIHFIYTSLQDAISLCKIQYHLSVAQYKAKHSPTKVVRKPNPRAWSSYPDEDAK